MSVTKQLRFSMRCGKVAFMQRFGGVLIWIGGGTFGRGSGFSPKLPPTALNVFRNRIFTLFVLVAPLAIFMCLQLWEPHRCSVSSPNKVKIDAPWVLESIFESNHPMKMNYFLPVNYVLGIPGEWVLRPQHRFFDGFLGLQQAMFDLHSVEARTVFYEIVRIGDVQARYSHPYHRIRFPNICDKEFGFRYRPYDWIQSLGTQEQLGSFLCFNCLHPSIGSFSSLAGFPRLPRHYPAGQASYYQQPPIRLSPPMGPFDGCVPGWRVAIGFGLICLAGALFILAVRRMNGWLALFCGFLLVVGSLVWLTGHTACKDYSNNNYRQSFQHNSAIVPQKSLDSLLLLGYIKYRGLDMANVLNTDKQIAIISALTEGSSIRSIERMTGVHRDTIMRLGVKVGQGCKALMDFKLVDLTCKRLELDEIWGFVGKKEKHVQPEDGNDVGSVWTFCAIDAETKLVPTFRVGKRDATTANAFMKDIASRMKMRVQISTDGLNAYVNAVENAFGGDVDYAQIIKVYGSDNAGDNRRYSQPEFVSSEKRHVCGRPDYDLISTSYIERLNATTRLHMRRLTRLTLAFSKKRENFEAAVALHFAYYNFVKRHNTLRCTPAMAAGVTGSFWSVGELLEATAWPA